MIYPFFYLKYVLQAHKIARCTAISEPSSNTIVASHNWLFSFNANSACMACILIHLLEDAEASLEDAEPTSDGRIAD